MLAERVTAGGYPAALARATARRQAAWHRDYADILIQRDVLDLTRISALDALPRLLALAAGQTAILVNVSELAAPFQVSRPTIRGYVTLLSRIFLLEELPPWYSNRISRLIKTPKLHLGDTGLACWLLGVDAEMLLFNRPRPNTWSSSSAGSRSMHTTGNPVHCINGTHLICNKTHRPVDVSINPLFF